MSSGRIWAGILLVCGSAVIPPVASAQSPYAINGLHSGLILSEAVAQAEKLGGICQSTTTQSTAEGKIVQCQYSHCVASNRAEGCAAENAGKSGPIFALQPIVQIVLEAPADTARLTRIVMEYEGDTDILAAGLIDAFGPTETNGAPTDTKSWSHARRWSWKAGQYHMGLMDSPQLIILATDPPQGLPAVDAEPGVVP